MTTHWNYARFLTPLVGWLLTSLPATAQVLPSDPFAVGRKILTPSTSTSLAGEDVVWSAMGRVRPQAVLKYASFDDYWAAIGVQRTGKALEGFYVVNENTRFIAMGDPRRILLISSVGQPHHEADLLLLNEGGLIQQQLQAKLQLRSLAGARRVLLDPRYEGMSILSTQESVDRLVELLLKEETKAVRRGLPLSGDAQVVAEGFFGGRLGTVKK